MIFTKNNLRVAASPYLRQHADNPIWWQEWSREVLDQAKKDNKPLFVSVGYATCHWCHVMAAEAFQDPAVASYLNEQFICVKVDREQRPDIDQFLMSFIVANNQTGGWPLNCFLTSDLKPFFALTYAPLQPRYGMAGFLQILENVIKYYRRVDGKVEAFIIPADGSFVEDIPDFVKELQGSFDMKFGGFGYGPKFPPHSTLLFMLYYSASSENLAVRHMVETTLDNILLGGLHDHLQGGFFRYSVDREWNIPHFEKMLYDQAMLLWVYSLAYHCFGKETYRLAVEKILKCLQETFEENAVYYSGHDADTDHLEGSSYLWTLEELSRPLTSVEFIEFHDCYSVSAQGNFEGKNHLRRNTNAHLDRIEEKLLNVRKSRRQPFVDRKIITAWNCLLGIGLVHAYRYAGISGALEKAEALAKEILHRHLIDGALAHSSFDGLVQEHSFLQDHAAMLLLLTYLYEDTGRYEDVIVTFREKVKLFTNERGWRGSWCDDFLEVPADSFDHPIPSTLALIELALLRSDILMGVEHRPRPYRTPLAHDFYNVASLLANGDFHIIETPAHISWVTMPINILQKKGSAVRDCYHGVCRSSLEQIKE